MRITKRHTTGLCILLALVALVGTNIPEQLYLSALIATQSWQRFFHDQIAEKLHLIKETNAFLPTASLALIGFLYGAIHSIGPGHGKVVVSSYLLASKNSLKRGLIITLISSLMQAVVAIALVFGLVTLLGLAKETAEQAATMLENISFGLIIMVGLVLVWRGIKTLVPHTHHHHNHEGCTCGCCGHSHAPDPAKLDKIDSLSSVIAIIFSIGLRPCSGAILLLLFAALIGVYSAGIMATFAMALGTALTTGILAMLTVLSKDLALKLVEPSGRGLHIAQATLSITGGLAIILMGTLFINANSISGTQLSPSDNAAALQSHPLMRSLRHAK